MWEETRTIALKLNNKLLSALLIREVNGGSEKEFRSHVGAEFLDGWDCESEEAGLCRALWSFHTSERVVNNPHMRPEEWPALRAENAAKGQSVLDAWDGLGLSSSAQRIFRTKHVNWCPMDFDQLYPIGGNEWSRRQYFGRLHLVGVLNALRRRFRADFEASDSASQRSALAWAFLRAVVESVIDLVTPRPPLLLYSLLRMRPPKVPETLCSLDMLVRVGETEDETDDTIDDARIRACDRLGCAEDECFERLPANRSLLTGADAWLKRFRTHACPFAEEAAVAEVSLSKTQLKRRRRKARRQRTASQHPAPAEMELATASFAVAKVVSRQSASSFSPERREAVGDPLTHHLTCDAEQDSQRPSRLDLQECRTFKNPQRQKKIKKAGADTYQVSDGSKPGAQVSDPSTAESCSHSESGARDVDGARRVSLAGHMEGPWRLPATTDHQRLALHLRNLVKRLKM